MGTSDAHAVCFRPPGAVAVETGSWAGSGELLVSSVVAELAAGSGPTLEPWDEHRPREGRIRHSCIESAPSEIIALRARRAPRANPEPLV